MLGIDGCLETVMEIPGARRATLVDGASGLAVAAAGQDGPVDEHEDAARTTDVVRAVLATPALATAPRGDDIDEIIVCGARGYHLLALVPDAFEGRLFLHLLIDRAEGNLALARLNVRRAIGALAGRDGA
ncbi:hypothetical protein [Actinomadura atramentaria]|uniref:hypothetical protein n=1 Tax=Actinomadura atramentaria TaxID=1990 RepID=UPI000362BB43|nr:hypothetical protein [Actinomadura atramentaria]